MKVVGYWPYGRVLLEILRHDGVDIGPYLDSEGLSEDDMHRTHVDFENAQFIRLVDRALRETELPALGLRVGSSYTLLEQGLLGYAMVSSATLRKAIDVHLHYQVYMNPDVTAHCCVEEDQVIVYFDTENRTLHAHPERKRYLIEETLYGWFKLGAYIEGVVDSRWLKQVNITCPAPKYAFLYEDYLKCPVTFSAARTELIFDRELLDREFTCADEAVAEMSEMLCKQTFNLSKKDQLIEQVYQLLGQSQGSFPSCAEVASELAYSERTLRRRLADLGTNYRDLVLDFRLELAREYIESTNLPVSEVAYLVGYSDVTNFFRAFRGKFDMPPAEYRRRARPR